MKTLLLSVAVVFASLAAHASCPTDSALLEAGWKIHPSTEFSRLKQDIATMFEREQADFVFDLKADVFSREAARWVVVTSQDRLSTAQEVMFGDLLFVADKATGELVELRWFDGQAKNVVFDPASQTCAMDLIPYADNALF